MLYFKHGLETRTKGSNRWSEKFKNKTTDLNVKTDKIFKTKYYTFHYINKYLMVHKKYNINGAILQYFLCLRTICFENAQTDTRLFMTYNFY